MSVYVTRAYEFACNAVGCEVVTAQISPATESGGRRDAWRVAETEGWTRIGRDQHYCPEHRDRPSNGRDLRRDSGPSIGRSAPNFAQPTSCIS